MRPLLVYLDSSDFSNFSNPKGVTSQHASILNGLRDLVAEKKIICVFSGLHLSEMAPIDEFASDAAEGRAEVLVDLCGRNALISLDILFAEELKYANHFSEGVANLHNRNGEWYPSGVREVLPNSPMSLKSKFETVIQEQSLNRESRRLIQKKGMKKGKPRQELQKHIDKNVRTMSLDEITSKYPMKLDNARVLARYVVGDATEIEATNAFLESLRDPHWMMLWFREHHEE